MPVSVVHIHAMRVFVLHGSVRVPVTVLPDGGRLMRMRVMAVVMPVGMLVLEG